MSYIFQAVLRNSQHPEYGAATIPFPIPREEYDHTVELLRELDIGDPVKRDCHLDGIDSYYSVLNRMVDLPQNLDELDYLAKRLDSFSVGEDAQFQAMAHKLELFDAKDLINLTFCCQQATVITDFSNMEKVGKDHYMNLHGGCAKTEELENLDGVETAHLLIADGDGTITPYGVAYDNGMKLEQLYDGQHFPGYLYDGDTVLVVSISPKEAPRDDEHKTLLFLPVADSQIERSMVRAGIRDCDEMRIELDGWLQFKDVFPEMYMEHESLRDLNDMAKVLAALNELGQKKLQASARLAKPYAAIHIRNLAEQLDQFDFVPDVQTPEEYGKYMIQESGYFEYDANLEGFYDFEKYGLQHIDGQQGAFTPEGYIGYQGEGTVGEVIYRHPYTRMDFQMGGMK